MNPVKRRLEKLEFEVSRQNLDEQKKEKKKKLMAYLLELFRSAPPRLRAQEPPDADSQRGPGNSSAENVLGG